LEDHAPRQNFDNLAPAITISAAARISGLSESALRKYEAAGLIIFDRTPGNMRLLCVEDLERIRLIQCLIRERGLNLEGIRRLWALLPCWEFKQCSEESRNSCPAIRESDRPCWVLRGEEKGCQEWSCRSCEVYRFGAYCTEDLKDLLHGLQKSE
jgi:MerR family transcriptional regulator/heat shock protein HspR